MDGELCLHPDYIEDIMDSLLEKDIISKNNVEQLKNFAGETLDPNIVMDMRHRKDKKESIVDIDIYKNKFMQKRHFEKNPVKALPKVKDLKTIEREISNTRRDLQLHQNQLVKENEYLTASISSLEKKREQNINSQIVKNMSEDETKHYFNLHLEHLEHEVLNQLFKEKQKTWKPFEIKPHPVINVTTSLKNIDLKHSTMELNKNNYELLEMCEMKPVYITGKAMKCSVSELQKPKEKEKNIVPNNTPILDYVDPLTCELNQSSLLKETEIIQNVIKIWRNYAKKRMCQKLKEEKQRTLKLNVLKRFFNSWRMYVKYHVERNNANLNQASNSKVNINLLKSNQNLIEPSKVQINSVLVLEQKTVELSNNIYPVKAKMDENVDKSINFQTNSKEKVVTSGVKSKTSRNEREGTKIHTKLLTIENTGLVNNKNEEIKYLNKTSNTKKAVKKSSSINDALLQNGQEPFSYRYAAKEEIITQQLAVIEKQKQIILDLKTQQLEMRSKLNLQTSVNQLVKTPKRFHKKILPIVKTPIKNECAINVTSKEIINQVNSSTNDTSQKLVKDMVERQEYCKQLAEMTRMRKIRIEKEQAKLKFEQEEKEKQAKEEQRRLKKLKMKIEQQLAQESAKNALDRKLHTTELTEKATNYYNRVLLNKAFQTFKRITSEIYLKEDECNQIYEKKLMKKILSLWRNETKQLLTLKNQSADNYYCRRLLDRCWNTWCRLHREYKIKLQVSEDFFALKLQDRMFRKWVAFTAQQYLHFCCKMELAERVHRKQLLKHVFIHWKGLPRLMFVEREKEQRRRAWRQAVQELIPDFSPVFAEQLEV